MKKIVAVVLFSAATPVFSAGVDASDFYAGLTLGVGNASFSAPAGSTAVVENPKSKPVYGAFGGYRYNKNLAFELAYTGASYIYTTPVAAGPRYLSKQIVLALTAVGSMPVSDAFSLYGKLGMARASSENNLAGEQTTSRVAPTFGIGAEYKFTPNISGRFGIDMYGVTATIPTTLVKQNSNATVMNAGVSYSF